MSKEREILKKILMLYRKDKSCMNCGTANEIQQLLAQQYEQEPVAWMYEFAVRSSWDASFTGEWKEEISRSKPITDGIVKGFNPTKLERTVRNLIPLYKAHGIGGGE